jgi:hypothetical protein
MNRTWDSMPMPSFLSGVGGAYRSGDLYVIHCIEEGRNHLSVSARGRYPTWDEIADARYHFIGDVDMAIILPPTKDYVNLHPFVFHCWEIRDKELPIERGTNNPRTYITGELA